MSDVDSTRVRDKRVSIDGDGDLRIEDQDLPAEEEADGRVMFVRSEQVADCLRAAGWTVTPPGEAIQGFEAGRLAGLQEAHQEHHEGGCDRMGKPAPEPDAVAPPVPCDVERLLAVARGCNDFHGGYSDGPERDAFHDGIDTVVKELESAAPAATTTGLDFGAALAGTEAAASSLDWLDRIATDAADVDETHVAAGGTPASIKRLDQYQPSARVIAEVPAAPAEQGAAPPLCAHGCGKPRHTHACLGPLVPRPGGGWRPEPGAAERMLERIFKYAKEVIVDPTVIDIDLRAHELACQVERLSPLRELLRLARLRGDMDGNVYWPTDDEWTAALLALDESCAR